MSEGETVLHVLVCGAGSIGQRHIRNLRELGVSSIAVFDPDEEARGRAEREYDTLVYTDYASALNEFHPDLVLVCSPPVFHVEQARAALQADAHVFIEKPISHQLAGIDDLIALAAERQRVVHVGYNLRFQPGLKKLKALLSEGVIGRPLWVRVEMGYYLPNWRPHQDYRQSYTAQRALGGGAILDISHEIDYALWLLGEPLSVMAAVHHLSDLEVDVEDSATLFLGYENRLLAEVHVDFIQRIYSRNCKIVGERGTLLWDFNEGVDHVWPDGRQHYAFDEPVNAMYMKEMEHLLASVRSAEVSSLPLLEAQQVLRVAMAAYESSESGQRIVLK